MPTAATVAPAELNKSLEHALVIDLDTSLRYRDGHVPGAWFAVRAGLAKTIPEMLAKQKGVTRIVLVSPDGEIAALAAAEAADAAGGLPVVVLAGGMKAWRDAKLPIEAGHTRMADPPTDVWYRPYDFKDNVEAAMRQYLEWEVDLVPQVARDGDAEFSVLKAYQALRTARVPRAHDHERADARGPEANRLIYMANPPQDPASARSPAAPDGTSTRA